jgi:hypothetical protein
MGLSLYDNIDICLLQKCDVGSCQVFIARDYFMFILFFVETWSNVNKVFVYLMVGTQFCGNREFQLFCEFECFIPKMWLWSLIFHVTKYIHLQTV